MVEYLQKLNLSSYKRWYRPYFILQFDQLLSESSIHCFQGQQKFIQINYLYINENISRLIQAKRDIFIYDAYSFKFPQQKVESFKDSNTNQMKKQSLLNDLRELKNSKPCVQASKSKIRMERVMEFQEANGISLDPNVKQQKKVIKKGGLFQGIVFCFPLIDPPHDPNPQRLVIMAKGIYSQGGKLIQFNYDLVNKNAKYILVDQRSDIGYIRQVLKGRIIYLTILNYKWVEECLRKFIKLEIYSYNLQRDYKSVYSRQQRLKKAEQISKNFENSSSKKAISQFICNKIDKKNITNNRSTEINKNNGIESTLADQNSHSISNAESDSDTEVMEDNNMEIQHQSEHFDHKQNKQLININQNSEKKNGLQESLKINDTNNESKEEESIIDKVQYEEIIPQIQSQKQLESSDQFEEKYFGQNTEFIDEIKEISQGEGKGQEDNIQSDGTEVMDGEIQKQEIGEPQVINIQKGYLRNIKHKHRVNNQKKQHKSTMKPILEDFPEVSRRKTKLSLGSHQFQRNNQICQKLKQMQQIYQDTGDRKQFAYLRAIAAIRNFGKQITIENVKQLHNVQGVGYKTFAKIREFLKTGSIAKVENQLHKTNSVPHKQLLRVYGIGLTTAEQLFHKGIRTIEDLKRNPHVLNKNQRMGLKYVQELEKRIPRKKITGMLQFVKQALFYLARGDGYHKIDAVGSYRRGKETCGDIDILITRKDGYVQKNLLQQLVTELEKRKFITDHITQPRAYDGRKSVNYMGVCQFQDSIHHRIDLKLYPVDQYAFALLYFTGSDLFNREMRMVASEKGFILGDHGIRKTQKNVGKPWKNSKIPICYEQEDIFKLLGMKYQSPAQRQL